MTQLSKVSVIIPCYNSEKYIEACLLSLIEQEYTNLEIIVIDDGSKDQTSLIVEKYIDIDKRIRLIKTENRGVSSARNTGLETATGDYITFIDSDDYIEADCFKKIINRMSSHQVDIALYAFCRDHNDFQEITPLPWSNKTILDTVKIKNELIPAMIARESGKSNVSGSVCRSIFYKEVVKNKRFNENISIQEDLIFCLYAYFDANKIMINNDVLYHYVKHSDTTTERYRKNYYSEAMNYESEIYSFLVKKGLISDIFDRYVSKKIGTYSLCISNLFRADAPSYVNTELKEILHGFRNDKIFHSKYTFEYFSKKKMLSFLLLKLNSKLLIKIIYGNKERARRKKLSD